MSSKYIDFPNVLSAKSTYVTDADVVRQNLERLLYTEKGELIDEPTYGVSLRKFLYEPMIGSVTDFIEMEVEAGINAWMSDVLTLRSVKVITDVDNHVFVVELDAYINEFDKRLVLQVPFDEVA